MDGLDFYLENLKVKNEIEINQEIINKIIQLATCGKKYPEDKIAKLISEVSSDYRKIGLRLILEKSVEKYSGWKKPEAKYDFYKIEAMQNYKEIQRKLHREILFVRREVHDALAKVITLCNEASSMTLISHRLDKCLTPEQFNSLQLQTAAKTIKYLKGQWLEKIINTVKICFREVGKGAFNIRQTDPWVYDVVKLKRLVNLIIQYMQTALNTLIKSSIEKYCLLLVIPMLDPSRSFLSLHPSLDAIFEVTLTTNSKRFSYAEEINELIPSLLKWIDEIVIELHAIKHPQAYLFPELKFPPDMFLSPIGLLDDVIVDAKTSIESFYRPLIGNLITYLNSYQIYLEFLSSDVESYLRDIEAENMDTHEIFLGLIHFKSELNCMNENLPGTVWIGVFKISIEAKKSLHDKYDKITRGLANILMNQCRNKVEKLIANYRDIEQTLTNTPHCIEETIEVENYIREIPYVFDQSRRVMDTVESEYSLLEAINCNIPTNDFNLYWEAIGYPLKITDQIKLTLEALSHKRLKLVEELRIDALELEKKIKSLMEEFGRVIEVISVENVLECAIEIKRMWKSLNLCKSQALIVNQRQDLFDIPVTDFDQLSTLENDFKPYKILWTTAAEWLKTEEQWLENPIININSLTMQSFIDETEQNIVSCVELFENQPDILKITSYISTKIESFKPYTLIVDIITFPGLKERHREEIIMQTGISISEPSNLTLQQILDLGIMTYMEIIAEVADKARKEYSVEVTLEKLSQSWLDLKLEIAPHNSNFETYVISVSNELFAKLEEDIREVQQINCEAFEASATEWAAKLQLIRQVLTTWVDVQRLWINLEPVFGNEGISRQLPFEYKKFNTVQRYWRRIIKKARQNSNILHLCSDKSLLNLLKECTGLMVIVKRGLANNADAIEPYVNKSLYNNMKLD